MSRNNKMLNKENEEIHLDNQIRVDFSKMRQKGQASEEKYRQISKNHYILEKLVLLALPSPSRHVH